MPLTNLASDCGELRLGPLEPGDARPESRDGDDEEEHQGHQEEQPAEGAEDPREEVGQHVGDLGRVDLVEGVARRVGAEAQLGQAVAAPGR